MHHRTSSQLISARNTSGKLIANKRYLESYRRSGDLNDSATERYAFMGVTKWFTGVTKFVTDVRHWRVLVAAIVLSISPGVFSLRQRYFVKSAPDG